MRTRLPCPSLRRLWIAVPLWLLSLAIPCPAKTLVVVLLPGTSLADWKSADAPHLHAMMSSGALAVMNTRSARLPNDHRRETPESAALTLGAGARAAGGTAARDFHRPTQILRPFGVTASELFTRRTGIRPAAGGWVNVQWAALRAMNTRQDYDVRLGNLADALRSSGVRMRAAGGSPAWAVAADGNGEIPGSPSHSRANECQIWNAGSDIKAADQALGSLMRHLGSGRMIVLSPSASDACYARGERLCPIVIWGNSVPAGLLYSPSTRQEGLITNTDFAPTAARFFGIPVDKFPLLPFGRVCETRAAPDAVARVSRLEHGAVQQWRGMHALPYLAIALGVWMLAGSLLTAMGRSRPAVGVVPAGLIFALIVSASLWGLVVWLSLLAVLLIVARQQGAGRLTWGLTAVTALILIADLVLRDPLMRGGLLGYSAIEGARYYGMGNEAMGALIGACLLIADSLWLRLSAPGRPLIWGGFCVVTLLLGSPLAGAKAGGLIVALAAFGSYYWFRSGKRFDGRIAALAAVTVVSLLATLMMLDVRQAPGQQSHFGQAAGRFLSGGVKEWLDIAARKLAVEGHLLYHSAWAVPLWGGLFSLLWRVKRHTAGHGPLLWAGLIAVAACLAVNDAGTVAGALCVSLLWGRVVSNDPNKNRRPTHRAAV